MSAKTIRETRREDIINAARDLFNRKGYHGTAMPEIAHSAGISTGLIYSIFPSKEDILLACCEEVATLHLDLFSQTSHLADLLERFDCIVRELSRWLDRGSKRGLATRLIPLAAALRALLAFAWVLGFLAGIILVVTPALVRDFSRCWGAPWHWVSGPLALWVGAHEQTCGPRSRLAVSVLERAPK